MKTQQELEDEWEHVYANFRETFYNAAPDRPWPLRWLSLNYDENGEYEGKVNYVMDKLAGLTSADLVDR